jgi:uncharacterized Zn finger protein (UPF0148 family)
MAQYVCPECGAKVRLADGADPQRQVRCPVCKTAFTPAAQAAAPVAAKPAPVPAAPPPKPKDDDNDTTAYGLIKESEEEQRLAELNKPKFTAVRDKYKRSSRGPAQALLVMPTNLMVGVGSLTGIVGIGTVIVGLFPIVFADAPPSDEEIVEQLVIIFGGFVALLYGALVCVGASKMQALESYAWAMIGAVMAIPLLFVGIFALITLRDKRVLAGFEEVEGAVDDEDEDEPKERDEDEDD